MPQMICSFPNRRTVAVIFSPQERLRINQHVGDWVLKFADRKVFTVDNSTSLRFIAHVIAVITDWDAVRGICERLHFARQEREECSRKEVYFNAAPNPGAARLRAALIRRNAPKIKAPDGLCYVPLYRDELLIASSSSSSAKGGKARWQEGWIILRDAQDFYTNSFPEDTGEIGRFWVAQIIREEVGGQNLEVSILAEEPPNKSAFSEVFAVRFDRGSGRILDIDSLMRGDIQEEIFVSSKEGKIKTIRVGRCVEHKLLSRLNGSKK